MGGGGSDCGDNDRDNKHSTPITMYSIASSPDSSSGTKLIILPTISYVELVCLQVERGEVVFPPPVLCAQPVQLRKQLQQDCQEIIKEMSYVECYIMVHVAASQAHSQLSMLHAETCRVGLGTRPP